MYSDSFLDAETKSMCHFCHSSSLVPVLYPRTNSISPRSLVTHPFLPHACPIISQNKIASTSSSSLFHILYIQPFYFVFLWGNLTPLIFHHRLIGGKARSRVQCLVSCAVSPRPLLRYYSTPFTTQLHLTTYPPIHIHSSTYPPPTIHTSLPLLRSRHQVPPVEQHTLWSRRSTLFTPGTCARPCPCTCPCICA